MIKEGGVRGLVLVLGRHSNREYVVHSACRALGQLIFEKPRVAQVPAAGAGPCAQQPRRQMPIGPAIQRRASAASSSSARAHACVLSVGGRRIEASRAAQLRRAAQASPPIRLP